jgi:alpha-amylase
MVKNMQPRAGKLNATKVLRTLPENEAFYFFEDIDEYTGKSASSLAEFCDITKTVDKKSIIFHFKRQDFERWAKETLHDPKLAKRINNIKKTKSEERLRTQIYKVSRKRLEELNNRYRKKRHAKPLKR